MTTSPLIASMFRLMRSFKSCLSAELEAEGLSIAPMHMKTLKMIAAMDECTAQRIAQSINRDKAQVNRVVQELVAQGMIERKQNPADKRSQLLHLSDKGEIALKSMNSVENRVLYRMTNGINIESQQTFITLAEQLRSNL
ncbi:MarR family transcriptional regulator (plasmid) [Acaryochloris sp. 'Moss Beach']|uniref:MarR family winged helix-turn-helix transcriptional regulator n=1 Tax=Acaryochloris sp. 'Moss Beach' TaxID=2740837 RepID=UPI001F25BC40|nr:MarR family transcriptional regulator [Acaryochloris sp. 'Moss Beach']UJB72394.1 MarR family transcriptional regulator [Acaryochloris sp. 'Moss Beach']